MRRLTVSLIALLATGVVAAQAQDIALDEIVVSANLEPTTQAKVGATVIVVNQADLQAGGENNVADYFRGLSGMGVQSRGTVGTQSTLLVRGASQNYLGTTIDGIDVTDPSGTQVAFDFGQLTTSDISRIEVLKGSHSALYGAGAVGGVISFTTLRATEDGFHQSLDSELGSYGTASLTYGATFRDDTTEAAVTVSRMRTSGFSNAAASEGNTEADGFDNTRLSFMVAHRFDNGLKLGLNGFAENSASSYDPAYYLPGSLLGGRVASSAVDFFGGDDLLVPLGDGSTSDEVLKRKSFALRASGEFSTGAVDHAFSVSGFSIKRSYHESEVAPNYFDYDVGTDTYGTYLQTTDASYTGARVKADWTSAMDVMGGRLVLGADASRETLDQSGDYGTAHNASSRAGVFGEFSTSLGDATDVSFALRQDHHSIFGNMPSARLAIVHRLTADTTLRLQAGSGYRAPSNFELFSFYGSTALQTEHSRTLDFGVEQSLGGLGVIKATAFLLEVDNLIDYNPTSTICPAAGLFGPGCYDQVSGTSRRKGVELDGTFNLGSDMTLTAAYTYTDSATNASSSWAQVPKQQVSLTLAAQITDTFKGQIGVLGVMDRPNWTDGTTAPDYAVVNAAVTHDFNANLEGYLRVENLFDQDYQAVQHYGTSGRALYAGLRAKF